jgi:predicted nucleic acid-binding protein
MRTTRAVFDASVLLRATVGRSEAARVWTERAESGTVSALTAELAWVEIAHVFRRAISSGISTADAATRSLVWLVALPIESRRVREMAGAALNRALETGLSAYDACYLVLAEAADATLVTADARLAAAARKADLIA